jgi:RimJ/RimL family protein N-acetyltransferase
MASWPLFDLRLRTARLELRLPDDALLDELCAVARAGIHPPDAMPFTTPWTRAPSPIFERQFLQFHWQCRASLSPESWTLELAVLLDGRPIGSQGVRARRFGALRQVATGSWLGRAHQGQGYGKEMRAAVLALAFDHLGAEVAESGAFLDNAASAGVSRALGYRENGVERVLAAGVVREHQRFRMTLEDWRARPRAPIEVMGLGGCRELLGA